MKNVFVSDMDGTFLRDDKTYDTDFFAQLHEQINHAEDQFIVATGNNFARVKDIFPTHSISAIAENGAALYIDDQLIHATSIANEKVTSFLTALEQLALPIRLLILSSTTRSYTTDNYQPHMTEKTLFFYKNLQFIPTFNAIKEPIIKISLKVEPELLAETTVKLQEAFGSWLTILPSGFQAIDILAHACDKGTGLKKLLAHSKMQPQQIVAFGNERNDLPLFHASDQRLAVANACELLKEQADKIIPSNQEQGVLTEIATFYHTNDNH
uniref:HAD-IIB family hydrolase n=1 Tax=Candidatus Enterococcus willemsii TaxID=1857215 RepID=UPI00403F5277